jgi:preprotein translocase subunit YajC
MKKSKEHKTMLDALQKGDEVVAVGFLGKISKVGPNYVAVEIAPNIEVQVERSAISRLLPKGTIKDAQ